MSLRSRLRGIGELGLVASGVPRVARARRRGDVLILAYHNVLPSGAAPLGDRSLHLTRDAFTAQLDWLAERYEIVPLDQIIERGSGPASRPRVAITFDDAYRGAVTIAVPELVARGMPATIFVAPAFVGGGTFWWDVLAAGGNAALDAEFRQRALHECCGADATVRQWARESGRAEQQVPDHATCASEAELREAASRPGITLGSHSWSHANLARLEGDNLRAELARPLAWLSERFDMVSTCLSYPYGSYTKRVAAVAASAGYRAALCIDGGWWMRGRAPDPFALPRLNVPAGLSLNGFVLRTAGLLCR